MESKFLEGTFEISFFFFSFSKLPLSFLKYEDELTSLFIFDTFLKNAAEDESEIEQSRAKIVCVSITTVDFLI